MDGYSSNWRSKRLWTVSVSRGRALASMTIYFDANDRSIWLKTAHFFIAMGLKSDTRLKTKTLKSILTGKTYVVRNSSFEGTGPTIPRYTRKAYLTAGFTELVQRPRKGENTTVSSSPCVPSSVEAEEKEPFPCCQ